MSFRILGTNHTSMIALLKVPGHRAPEYLASANKPTSRPVTIDQGPNKGRKVVYVATK